MWMRNRESQFSGMKKVVMLCSWAGDFALTVPFSTQEYKDLPMGSYQQKVH